MSQSTRSKKGKASACNGCDKPDYVDNMVQCDLCDNWWHFSCAKVDASIKTEDWACSKCFPKVIRSSSGKSSTSTARARKARLELELHKLEEEMALAAKLQQEKEAIDEAKKEELERQEKLLAEKKAREEDFLRRKYSLLEEVFVEDENKSVRSQESSLSLSVRKRVEEWMSRHGLLDGAVGGANALQTVQSQTDKPTITVTPATPDVSKGAIPKTQQVLEVNGKPDAKQKLLTLRREFLLDPSLKPVRRVEDTVNMGNFPEWVVPNPTYMGGNHGVLPPAPHPRINPRDVNSGLPPGAPFIRDPAAAAEVQLGLGPTSQQLAARHVVPKDLPTFSGNPTEWPLFISAYQNSTTMCGFSDCENLMRLQRCLKGNALEAVRSHLLMPSFVPIVISTLTTLYGRPELIVQSLLSRVRSVAAPRSDKLETLISFGLVVQNLCGHLKAAQQEAQLSNPTLLQELVDKLPANIKLDWALYKRSFPVVNLGVFGDYMTAIVAAASDVTVPTCYDLAPKVTHSDRTKAKSFLNAHATEDGDRQQENLKETDRSNLSEKPKLCLICEKPGHRAKECLVLKKMTVDARWKATEQHNLCNRCLIPHGRWPCRASQNCGIDGCESRHHRMLHPGKSESSSPIGTISAHQDEQLSSLFRIVPVVLQGKHSSVETYAFLDDGSSLTLLEAGIAKELGVSGPTEPLCLKWTANVSRRELNSQKIEGLEISAVNGGKRFPLSMVRTVESLDLPKQSLHFDDMVKDFPYLRGLPMPNYDSAVPRILIGLDNLKLTLTLKKREGRSEEPVATKTRLGWTVYGNLRKGLNAQTSLHICECSESENLHDLVRGFFETETLGIGNTSPPETEEDQRARRILQETTVRTSSGKFETGLLWRYDTVNFPNSFPMAERRLKCLERRLQSIPDLQANLSKQILEYQQKGYAHKASEAELRATDPGRAWYLPLGVVLNPRKPGKVRVIWDAAAKVQGVSLNSMLLKGPDLLSSLPAVLSRYRQRQFAVTGDIREMFHQVLIRREDRQSQRFLWRDSSDIAPEVYIMDVATFGSTCSPCAAQYVKNLNAKEYEKKFPEAAKAIRENHYVDDYLDSKDTEEEAVKTALEVKEVHAKAGFEIRNWLSNSDWVLRRVGEQNPDGVKSFSTDKTDSAERVLGLVWLPEEDVFSFEISFRADLQPLVRGEVTPTKRQVLQVVMSLFDPLGMISTFLIHGKMLIQEIWRSGVGWDDVIPVEVVENWNRWIGLIDQLRLVKVPRCYFPNYSPECYNTLELHMFVDASESAYCCVAYFRIIDRGQPRLALVASKTKVAPLKPLSVPRLELQAAVIGTRMADTIAENHTVPVGRRYFWTDSTVTLARLNLDPHKFKQFEKFRIGEIRSKTSLKEWRWVPTKLNVADEGTKWGKGPSFEPTSRWYSGPDFLLNPEELWPQRAVPPAELEEEMRSLMVHHPIVFEPTVEFERFSKWERLSRAIAYVHRFINRCRRCCADLSADKEFLSSEELKQAEMTLWKWTQHQVYSDELNVLLKNQQHAPHNRKKIERSSPLWDLSPFVDTSGIIRMETRLVNAIFLPFDSKYLIILPKNHYVTTLLVDRYHRDFEHANGETIH